MGATSKAQVAGCARPSTRTCVRASPQSSSRAVEPPQSRARASTAAQRIGAQATPAWSPAWRAHPCQVWLWLGSVLRSASCCPVPRCLSVVCRAKISVRLGSAKLSSGKQLNGEQECGLTLRYHRRLGSCQLHRTRTRRAAVLRGPRSVVRGPWSVVVFGGPGSNWTTGTETETETEAEIVMASWLWGDGMAQHRQSSICNQRDPK